MTETLKQAGQEHPFAPFIRILGKGKSGTRALTQSEAHEAFTMILQGAVEPLQLGAFLMLLRVKEETPEEVAGFVQACRDSLNPPPEHLTADLDWSSYAGKKHQHPWYILAALLLADAGHRVFIHGSAGHTAGRLYTETALQELGLPVADNWHDVDQQLQQHCFSYLSLEHFCDPLHQLMQLRPLLGLRSPVNTLARLVNPLRAPSSLQSVFHPAYAVLHQQADLLLGQPNALAFKGESGEVEIKPSADTRLLLLRDNHSKETTLSRSLPERAERVGTPQTAPLRDLWHGLSEDDYGLNATLATAAVALNVMQPELNLQAAQELALELWQHRKPSRLQ